MLTYLKEEIMYHNGRYNWKRIDDLDNSYYIKGSDHTILNRNESREILYFINHLARKWWGDNMTLSQYQKIDSHMRSSMPDHIHSHLQIENWLVHQCINKYP